MLLCVSVFLCAAMFIWTTKTERQRHSMKTLVQGLIKAAFITLGILSAAFGLKGFLLSSHFIDGGVTGVSMLLSNVLGWQLALLIPIINVPFIALAYKQIGRDFAIRSILAIAGL